MYGLTRLKLFWKVLAQSSFRQAYISKLFRLIRTPTVIQCPLRLDSDRNRLQSDLREVPFSPLPTMECQALAYALAVEQPQ